MGPGLVLRLPLNPLVSPAGSPADPTVLAHRVMSRIPMTTCVIPIARSATDAQLMSVGFSRHLRTNQEVLSTWWFERSGR